MDDAITPTQFNEAEGVGDWRIVCDGACTFIRTASFDEAARLVQAIAGIPEIDRHRPNIDVRADGVTVGLITIADDYYGMSMRDVELARAISTAARELGLSPDPDPVQSLLVIPGATDTSAVMPFWQAALGYARRGDTPEEDLVDPRGRGPSFWFEHTPIPQRMRRAKPMIAGPEATFGEMPTRVSSARGRRGAPCTEPRSGPATLGPTHDFFPQYAEAAQGGRERRRAG